MYNSLELFYIVLHSWILPRFVQNLKIWGWNLKMLLLLNAIQVNHIGKNHKMAKISIVQQPPCTGTLSAEGPSLWGKQKKSGPKTDNMRKKARKARGENKPRKMLQKAWIWPPDINHLLPSAKWIWKPVLKKILEVKVEDSKWWWKLFTYWHWMYTHCMRAVIFLQF